MRVLVTGGLGLIGRTVVNRLLAKGWDIRVIDIAKESDLPDSIYSVCDITDFEAVRSAVRDCDAIVHMAALRSPYMASAPDLFRINVQGTFNLYEAAAHEGIKRVVQASSINAIGCAWKINDFAPPYLPIDENLPTNTDDVYSYSKQAIESIGAYYWRRDGISGVGFRFPWVYPPSYFKSEHYYERRNAMRKLMDDLLQKSEAERNSLLALARQRALDYRVTRPLEYPANKPAPANDEGMDHLLWQAYTFDRYNLWVFVHVEDAAQAVEKSLTADYEGSHPLFINDDHNWMNYDSRTLADLFFPEITDWKQDISGTQALVSINKARNLIGFAPEFTIAGDTHD